MHLVHVHDSFTRFIKLVCIIAGAKPVKPEKTSRRDALHTIKSMLKVKIQNKKSSENRDRGVASQQFHKFFFVETSSKTSH